MRSIARFVFAASSSRTSEVFFFDTNMSVGVALGRYVLFVLNAVLVMRV